VCSAEPDASAFRQLGEFAAIRRASSRVSNFAADLRSALRTFEFGAKLI
jgi:hypothetical protein